MARDTRERLLEHGVECFMHKGFNNTGLQEILNGVGVPKGSFYHYFKSKEEFGLEVLRRYASCGREMAESVFSNTDMDPIERFRRFFDMGAGKMAESGYRGGCLLGNMAGEMGDLNKEFERLLEDKIKALTNIFASCIKEAQDSELIANRERPCDLAEFLMNSWHGAILRTKVAKCGRPLDLFRRIVFDTILVRQGEPVA